MRKYALLLLVAACGTDGTTPTASGVFPAEGFTGRSLRVEISGDATTWKDGATVDFGAGVTVNKVDVASPTDLFADITIDPAAAVGKNDVTVTNGSKKYTLTGAFELVSPTPITWSGDVAQGGVPFFTIENLDFSHQFDTTTDPNTGNPTGVTITGPAGTQAVATSVTPFEIQGQLFIDVNAAASAGPLTVVSGSGATAFTSIPGNADIKARTPVAFTGSATINLPEKGSSQLYAIAATGPTLFRYTVSGTSADSTPVSEVLNSGGTWTSDAVGASPAVIDTGNGYLLVESFGTAPDTVTVTGLTEALTSAAEVATSNDLPANAQSAGGIPFRLTAASISTGGDVDYVKFVAPTGSTGKHLHVDTDAGNDTFTDTAVTITTGNNGTTAWEPKHDDGANCSFFGCDGGEDFTTTATLTAGTTYYIRVEAGANYMSSDTDYVMLLWLE